MTYREIAEKLNVSPATISHVINNKPGVSEATRETIRKQLEELGLSHLLQKKESAPEGTKVICFLVYKCTGQILDRHPYFLLITQALERRAAEYGYSMMIRVLDKHSDPAQIIPSEKTVDGMVLFATEMSDEDFAVFSKLKYPVVALDNALSHTDCSAVSINNEMGTFQAIEYLVKTGHQRIGYFRSTIDISSFFERCAGYLQSAEFFGRPIRSEDVLRVGYTDEESFRDILQYLKGLDPDAGMPDAFVCDDDPIAFGALRAFAQCGIRVPEDVSIIGFNNHSNCPITNPPLTSVEVHPEGFLPGSIDLLVDLIRKKEKTAGKSFLPLSQKTRFSTSLVIRDSAKKY